MTTEVPRELNNLIDVKRQLEDLQTNPAFLRLNEIMQEQVDSLQREVLFIPCTTIDRCVEQEYKKGQLRGLLAWGDTLDSTIASLTFDIKTLKDQQENESDGRATPSNSAP